MELRFLGHRAASKFRSETFRTPGRVGRDLYIFIRRAFLDTLWHRSQSHLCCYLCYLLLSVASLKNCVCEDHKPVMRTIMILVSDRDIPVLHG